MNSDDTFNNQNNLNIYMEPQNIQIDKEILRK